MHEISTQSILKFTETDLPKSIITNNLETFKSFFTSFNIDSIGCTNLKIEINLKELKKDNFLIYEELLKYTEKTLDLFIKKINLFILNIFNQKLIEINEELITYLFNITDFLELEPILISNFYMNLPFNYLNEELISNKLILLKCKFHLIKQECYILSKIYRCTNTICSKKKYFLEKIDFLNSKILNYSIDIENRKIEKIFSIPQFCNNCELNLSENFSERKIIFLYFYTLFNELLFIQAISFEPLNSVNYILGRINKYYINPVLYICGFYKEEKEFYEFKNTNITKITGISKQILLNSNINGIKNNNLIPENIKNIYKITHSSFEVSDLIHTQINLILSIFLVYETKITIFTQDCIFLQNYAINFFKVHCCDTQVNLFNTSDNNSLIILNESEINQLNSNYHFFVETNKSFINYSYEFKAINNSFIKYELSEESVNKIQEIYLKLRKEFENNISPIKLLEIVKYLSEGMATLIRSDLTAEDFRIIEHTCIKCIIPDIKVECMKKRRNIRHH